MFQRKYLIYLGALGVFAIVWLAGWFFLADVIRSDIEAFAAERRADGVILEWDRVDITGFPIRFDTRFTAPRGRWTTPERNISWSGADTTVRPFADAPNAWRFRAPGTHRIEVQDSRVASAVSLTAETLQGRIGIGEDGRVRSVRGEALPVALAVENGPGLRAAKFAFDWSHENVDGDANALHPEDQRRTLTIAADAIDLSGTPLDMSVTETLGQTIARLAGRIVLRGDLDPEAISPRRLARWRDAGGTLEAEKVQLVWGPLQFFGDGTLSLDNALQPEGAFTARIAGLDKLIDLLEARGEVRPQQAAIARIALAVLTRAPSDGGPPAATVPITIQNRVVSVGPVPLLTLEPVVWN